MDIDDIDDQIAGLYALKKQKKTEQKAIRAAMREKARRGELPFSGMGLMDFGESGDLQ